MAFGISENTTSYFLNNKIDLPRFQRKATWDERDNFKLCISVFKGYPIGVIIVNETGTKKFLLDGRQRRNALMYTALRQRNIAERRCVQLQNLITHCGYERWAIDSMEACDLMVCTLDTPHDDLKRYACFAQEHHITLCIIEPYRSSQRWEVCREILDNHSSTTIDNRAYVLVFNNHLPKQRYTL